jgi:hypothetical protein
MLGASSSVHANDIYGVALCGGCTTTAQFRAVGAAYAGDEFSGTRVVLVVNPDTGDAMNVSVIWTPRPGSPYHPRAIPAPSESRSSGNANRTAKRASHRAQNIYTVDSSGRVIDSAGRLVAPARVHNNTGSSNAATASPVSAREKTEIGALIQLAKKTYVVRLPAVSFPSYRQTEQLVLAHYNYDQLMANVQGWPATHIAGPNVLKDLIHAIENYFGRDLEVCDIWPNGDSACFEPDPGDHNVLRQIGDAKDKDGNILSALGTWVPGGAHGGGMQVRQRGDHFLYGVWDSMFGRGNKWLVCGYVGGKLDGCRVEIP